MTRQQDWSVRAHTCVAKVASGEGNKAKYNTFCRKMPSLIQTSGLIQAIIFVESRGADGQRFIDDLANVYSKGLGRENLRKKAQSADLAEYLALSRDLIHVAIWFRRFAQIDLGDTEDNDQ